MDSLGFGKGPGCCLPRCSLWILFDLGEGGGEGLIVTHSNLVGTWKVRP